MQRLSSLQQPSIWRTQLHPAIVIGRLIRHESVQTTSVLIRSFSPRAISVIEKATYRPLPKSLIYISHPTTFTLGPAFQRTSVAHPISTVRPNDRGGKSRLRRDRAIHDAAEFPLLSRPVVVSLLSHVPARIFMCRDSRVILVSRRHRDATRRIFLSPPTSVMRARLRSRTEIAATYIHARVNAK